MYIHIPFCGGKCPYCDFYSVAPTEELCERYGGAVHTELQRAAVSFTPTSINTIYIGGGTPPLLGSARLAALLDRVREQFPVEQGAEVTVEVNPRTVTRELVSVLAAAGVNRISMGAQSGVESELELLGRQHSPDDIRCAADVIHEGGIENLSLDIMLCFPGQTIDTLQQSAELLFSCNPEHISAYLFKVEEGTPFHRNRDSYSFPDEDEAAEIYLAACEIMESAGFCQYEISNFAKPGRESRHNLKYWNAEEYIGIGPAAHGFVDGQRYYYERSLSDFIAQAEAGGAARIPDGSGGDAEEYAMLRLRLAEGLEHRLWQARFGEPLPAELIRRARQLAAGGLVVCDERGVRLTRQGFLVSNAVIAQLVYFE
ncbi:MAG: radical SAM family heme chaperone HemW [Ruminococcaceae bacterium]|nr:radical SAM family heme chaperone HemW [Oscillospiraceae bacterium]